ncbi:terpene synthase family protein [Nocardia sp. NPDC004568]|uniref:terpene synthase family protein n=1 Tax=Nocardia sp. NPDC004568 TaxID=3154551 RepID=UPI0033B76B90
MNRSRCNEAAGPSAVDATAKMALEVIESFGVPCGQVSSARNGHAEQAHMMTRNWANQYGLLGDPHRQEMFDQLRYADMLAYGCTTAPPERLALFAQWFTYYFLLDDQQDLAVLTGRTEDFVALQKDLHYVFHSRGVDGSARTRNFSAAVADLCRCTAPHVSDEWWDRYVSHADEVFAAQRAENVLRLTGTFPDPEEFKVIRRRAGAADMVFDIIEACEGMEIPESIRYGSACSRYADDLNDFTTWTNDVLGVDHDAANGDPNNYVLIREHAGGLDRRTAIETVTAEIVELVANLPIRREDVRRSIGKFSVPQQIRIERSLDAWFDWAMNVPIHYMRAHGRLAQMDRARPGEPPAFTEDLLNRRSTA